MQAPEWHTSPVVGVRTVIITAELVVPHCISRMRAIGISEKMEVFTGDAARTTPVFNYAGVWEWWWTIETIARAFEHAD